MGLSYTRFRKMGPRSGANLGQLTLDLMPLSDWLLETQTPNVAEACLIDTKRGRRQSVT